MRLRIERKYQLFKFKNFNFLVKFISIKIKLISSRLHLPSKIQKHFILATTNKTNTSIRILEAAITI